MVQSTTFRELLAEVLEGKNVKKLAANAGIDRSVIYKAKRGESLSPEAAAALGGVLGLSPAEHRAFMDAYRHTRTRQGVGERRSLVGQFIARFDELSALFAAGDTIRTASKQDLNGFDKPVQPIYGSLSIRKILSVFLEHEAAKEAGHIKLKMQPETRFIEALFPVIDNHRSLTVEHILCFEAQNEGKVTVSRNLSFLSNILPFLISSCTYIPLSYYEKSPSSTAQAAMLPNLVLTGDCALCISEDFESAILYRSQEMLSFFEKQFQYFAQLATAFTKKFSPLEHLNVYAKATTDPPFYSLSSEPCFTPFFDEAILKACINSQLPHPEDLIAAILTYSRQCINNLDTPDAPYFYFTQSGLRRFMETGRLSEIPSILYTPIPLPMRKQLVNRLYKAAAAEKHQPVLLKDEHFHMPNYLSIASYQSLFILGINHPTKGFLSIIVEEKSLVQAFYDYLSHLHESDAASSLKETKGFLEDILLEERP